MVLQKTQRSQKGYRSPKGKSVYAQMGIWREGKEIHMTIPTEENFHTTVNNKEGSKRCHENLYAKLERLLKENDRWE